MLKSKFFEFHRTFKLQLETVEFLRIKRGVQPFVIVKCSDFPDIDVGDTLVIQEMDLYSHKITGFQMNLKILYVLVDNSAFCDDIAVISLDCPTNRKQLISCHVKNVVFLPVNMKVIVPTIAIMYLTFLLVCTLSATACIMLIVQTVYTLLTIN